MSKYASRITNNKKSIYDTRVDLSAVSQQLLTQKLACYGAKCSASCLTPPVYYPNFTC